MYAIRSYYDILEEEAIPQFYDRGYDGLPTEWLNRIRESMKSIIPEFNTNRMVKDYTEMFYHEAHKNFRILKEDNYISVKTLAKWKDIVKDQWSGAKILDMSLEEKKDITVGTSVNAFATVDLGKLSPDDVMVELYFGSLDQFGDIPEGVSRPMRVVAGEGRNIYRYEGQILCLGSGKFGYSVRNNFV